MLQKKLKILKTEIEEKGLVFGLRRLLGYIFSPFQNKIQKSRFLLELFYGFFPRLSISRAIKINQTDLLRKVRVFWYKNIEGEFDLDGQKITRKDIFVYGGPDPQLVCPICQKSEWLSRIRQKNLFVSHGHSTSNGRLMSECAELICQKQGDELWANFHQNFNFSLDCDSSLPAVKMLYLDPNADSTFFTRHCDIWQLLTHRRLAFTCQVTAVKSPFNVDWSKYDCLFIFNDGKTPKFKKPNIPLIMYGHDFWPLENKGFQWAIDWARPDLFLSSALEGWQEYYRFPAKTKFAFYPFFDSSFFSRPNLREKKFDLLLIGAVRASLYQPRSLLFSQIAEMASKNRYRIELQKTVGSNNVFRLGSVVKKDAETGIEMRFLNKWSEYLGSSNYAIFGRTKFPFVTGKHYEVLGSGAVPIFPEAADFKYLGIKAFEHYIPLSEVEGNNEKLTELLQNYGKYQKIAENAVNWYTKNSDRLIFDEFEEAIRGITDYKYPKRLI